MALDPSIVVRIREQITPQALATRDFSKTLFLHTPATSTDSEFLRLTSNVRSYATLDQVENDWSSGTAPHMAASVYFQQSPFPGQFAVGSYFSASRAGVVDGVDTTTSQADVQAFGANAAISIMGVDVTADVSSVATPQALAGALATGINANANITGVTVSATGTAFTSAYSLNISIPAALALVGALDVTQGPTGALMDSIGLSESAGAVFARPFAQDTNVGVALSRAEEQDPSWYFSTLSPDLEESTSHITNASAWTQTRRHMFGYEYSDTGALLESDTTSPIAVLGPLQRTRTFGVFTRNKDGKAISICARFSSVNYDGIDSNITISHKTLPGTTPDTTLTDADVELLDSRGANVYVNLAGAPRVIFGRAASGYIDQRIWTDWLVDRLQTTVLGLLSSSNRIDLSERGSGQILAVVRGVCRRGRENGGFVPGELDQATIGSVRQVVNNDAFDGTLPDGFLAYVAPQDQADTDTRTAPPVYVWGIYRGGVNKVNLDIRLGG